MRASRGLVIRLEYRSPLRWQELIDFLRERAVPGVEVVQDDAYRRTIRIDGCAGVIDVRPDQNEPSLVLRTDLPECEHLMKLVEGVRRIFDLGADPLRIQQDLSCDSRLKRIVECRPGLRVPGVWDGFELAVRAVLGEQLTIKQSRARAGRLVQAFGQPLRTSVQGLTHLFPMPDQFVNADLSKVGLDVASAVTVKNIARAVCSGHFAFSRSFTDLDDVISRICDIGGISATTAHYIAMRALGETDAFPFADPGFRTKFANGRPSSASDDLLSFAERWRPWRAYAAIQLYTAGRAAQPF